MLKTMIVLWGEANSGKSTTIAYVLEELLKDSTKPDVQRGYKRRAGPPEVWYAVLNVQGTRVGITSQGDSAKFVYLRVEPLVAADCRIIICVTRPRGGSVEAVENIAGGSRPPFEIDWIEKVASTKNRDKNDRATCTEVVNKALRAVGLKQQVIQTKR